MKILVMGAGAVGGYFGARLTDAGNDVFFVARGTHLETMREKGLRVKSPDGDLELRVKASNTPADAGIVDLVLLAVKSQDVGESLDLFRDCVGPETTILTIQNGVSAEEEVVVVFGKERGLGGVAYIGVLVEQPGVIVHSTLGRLAIGELEGAMGPRVRMIEEMFRDAGIPVTVSESIMETKWRKLVWNAAFNAVSVLTGMRTRAMAESEELRPVLTGIMEEVVAVANAGGHHLDRGDILGKTFELTRKLENVKTSMLQDFEKGKKLELAALNGVVVKKGRELGVPTPVNETVCALVRVLEKKWDHNSK